MTKLFAGLSRTNGPQIIPSVPVEVGWYYGPGKTACYVHAVTHDVDTGKKMVVFITHHGPDAGRTVVQALEPFVAHLNNNHYLHAGIVLPDDMRKRLFKPALRA